MTNQQAQEILARYDIADYDDLQSALNCLDEVAEDIEAFDLGDDALMMTYARSAQLQKAAAKMGIE